MGRRITIFSKYQDLIKTDLDVIMKEILAKLEAILLTIQHPFLRDSESSLSKEELIHLFNANKLALNEELIDLYLWKG